MDEKGSSGTIVRRNPSRRCKRTSDFACVQTPMKKHAQARSYFDTIPLDACEDIVRFLCDGPMEDIWIGTMDPESVFEVLLGFGGPLAEAVKRSVTCIHESPLYAGKPRGLLLYTRGKWSYAFLDRVLRAVRPNLKKIVVDRKNYPLKYSKAIKHTDIDSLELNANSPAQQLKISHLLYSIPEFEGMLKACSQIRRLTLVSHTLCKEHIDAIARHCIKLRILCLTGVKIDSSLEPIWRSVGQNLTEIHLIGVVSPTNEVSVLPLLGVDTIITKCSNAKLIRFHNIPDLSIGYFRSLVSSTKRATSRTVEIVSR